MLRVIVTGLFLVAMAAPAMAFQCPSDVAKIDAALTANPSLDKGARDAVQSLRDEGESLHNSGKHQESVDTLAKAKDMLKELGVSVE